ncbi:hypothetical protein ACFL2U_00770 [Patescibacteria group bacterium]
MKAEIKITVHKQGGKYYATRSLPGNENITIENVVFTVTKEIEPDQLPQLEEEAKKKARENGIEHVINLD